MNPVQWEQYWLTSLLFAQGTRSKGSIAHHVHSPWKAVLLQLNLQDGLAIATWNHAVATPLRIRRQV